MGNGTRLHRVWLFFCSVVVLTMTSPVVAADVGAAPPGELQTAIDLYHARRDSDAKAALEAIFAKEPQNHAALSYLARLAKRRKDWDEVIERYEFCLRLAPNNAEYWANASEAYARKAQRDPVFSGLPNIRKCREAIVKAVELDPETVQYRVGLFEFYRAAPRLIGGSMKLAREQLAEIAKRDAGTARMLEGKMALDEDDWAEAERAFRAAAELQPEKLEPRIALAELLIRQKKYGAAREFFAQLLESTPDSFLARYQLGRLAALSGEDLERGESCLRTYLSQPQRSSLLPTHAEARLRLGEILLRKGDRASAKQEFAEALKLEPWSKDAKKAVASVN